MLQSIKYRSYPNAQQAKTLAQMFGNQRFIWNHFLGLQKERLDAKTKLLTRFDMEGMLPALRAEHPWLKESKVDALRTSIAALDNAFRRFFGRRFGFPKFKSKRDRRVAVTTSQVSNSIFQFNRSLGPIEISEHRPIPSGNRKRLTIIRVPSGKYFTSVVVDTGATTPIPMTVSGVIGMDEGLTDFITLSTGRKIKHGKYYRANLRRLKSASRQLSRKVKGSNRHEKQRVKVARLHEKIANSRSFETHLISTNLVRKAVRESQAIAFQKSSIANQIKNHSLALSIGDAAWGELRGQLAYKCAKTGVPLVEIDQWVPTSYPCHNCGVKAESKTLWDRSWTCAGCSATIDRDVNAALNIARLGLEELKRREAPCLDVQGGAATSAVRLASPPDEASSGATRAKGVGVSN